MSLQHNVATLQWGHFIFGTLTLNFYQQWQVCLIYEIIELQQAMMAFLWSIVYDKLQMNK